MRPHYATDSTRKGFLSFKTPDETRKRGECDLVRRIANPCLSPLVGSYLTIVPEALKQIGVNRAAPLLENTIIGLRSDRRSRAQVAASWLPYLCDERCSPLLVGVFFVV